MDIDRLLIAHKGSYYLDLALSFGYCFGSIFSVNKHGLNALLNYICFKIRGTLCLPFTCAARFWPFG